MSPETARDQAEAFVAWSCRMPAGGWDELFARWSRSKDFAPSDERAIRRALVAMGVKVRAA